MPTIGTHVPADWPYASALGSRLLAYRGKPAPYIRDLIERDLRQHAARRGLTIAHSPAAQNRWTSLVESERGDASRECAAGASAPTPTPEP